MIRLVLIVLAMVAFAVFAVRIVQELRRSDADWQGLAFAGGFVALAFYLSEATGIGGIG